QIAIEVAARGLTRPADRPRTRVVREPDRIDPRDDNDALGDDVAVRRELQRRPAVAAEVVDRRQARDDTLPIGNTPHVREASPGDEHGRLLTQRAVYPAIRALIPQSEVQGQLGGWLPSVLHVDGVIPMSPDALGRRVVRVHRTGHTIAIHRAQPGRVRYRGSP